MFEKNILDSKIIKYDINIAKNYLNEYALKKNISSMDKMYKNILKKQIKSKLKVSDNMTNESKKDFNSMMKNNKDMPKIQIVEDEDTIKKYGGSKMFFAPPLYYDELMKKVPKGKLITVSQMRNYLAKKYNADFTDPMTAGIFVNIVAWASFQRDEDITPYWRTLKSDGELNTKYPEAIELQKRLLKEEGHIIITKGIKNIKYYVKDFEKSLIEL